MGSKPKKKGLKPLQPKQKRRAILATRVRKQTVPKEVLLKGWEGAIANKKMQLPTIPDSIHPNSYVMPNKAGEQATQAATDGVNHAAERESVFKREKAERFALEHHLGKQSFDELQKAMGSVGLVPAKHRFTTEAAIDRELATIAIMESGQDHEEEIAAAADVEHLTANETTLTVGQYQAILNTVTSHDQFIAWQGVAGAGKTYSLKLVAQLATSRGYKVTGYAPSAQAANVLAEEANIEGNTVARLLHSQSNSQKKAIWIVDEASLLSAKDAYALLKKAQVNNARIILVGDTRQLSAVEAGNPFKSLQLAGIQTCLLEESRRQKTETLRAAVVCLSAGEQAEGLTRLDRAGMVHEIEEREDRHRTITHDYMNLSVGAREKTLMLSGTNEERLALTTQLRTALQEEGRLGQNTFEMKSLRPIDCTKTQLKYASTYQLNNVVVTVKDYRRYGMKRRVQYQVIARDIKNNRLTLQSSEGKPFVFDPATCVEKTTYEVQTLPIAQGEQLRWTRNEAVEGVRNGQTSTVDSISRTGKAVLRNTKGEMREVDLTGEQYLDYALVNTTYSSQGKTADQVLADIDSGLSQEGLYVAVSRAKSSLKMYTASKEKLHKRAQRSAAKQNPSDFINLSQLVNPDDKNQIVPKSTELQRVCNQSQRSSSSGREFGRKSDRASTTSDNSTARRASSTVERAKSIEYTATSVGRTTASIDRSISTDAARSHRAATDASGQLEAVTKRRRDRLVQQHEARRLERYQTIYRRYAAAFPGGSSQSCDQWIAQQAIRRTFASKEGKLSKAYIEEIALMLRQSPAIKRIKHTEGEAATHRHVKALLKQELEQLSIDQHSEQSR